MYAGFFVVKTIKACMYLSKVKATVAPVKSTEEISKHFVAFFEYMTFSSKTDAGFWYLQLKFIYSEKTTKFCKISNVDLSSVVPVKSTVEISQNFVAFSEYKNFTVGADYLFELDSIETSYLWSRKTWWVLFAGSSIIYYIG